MTSYIPPLHALRAFEAAARHLSYSRAAEELALTHGAISHHITRLEKDLGGVRLFVRDGQRMLPTDAGQILVMEVRQGLRILEDAMEAARTRPRQDGARRSLAISTLPSLAGRWLVPRLPRFQAAYPDIDVAIHLNTALASLDGRDGIVFGIRYGSGKWSGLKAAPLMKSYLVPMASPDFLARTKIETPADLPGAALRAIHGRNGGPGSGPPG
jgi:DNA-binding transcriptional LysR family regulator